MEHQLRPAISHRHAAARWPRTWLRLLLPTLAAVLCGAGGTTGESAPARDPARAEWVVSQIEAKNANLQPAVRAEKYAAMAEGVLAFFRSTNYLYWADFSHSPLLNNFGSPTTRIWLQGDAHAENIGALANSQGAVVYDLDDFDEVVIGDYQLDLWRLGISLILFARENGGFSAADQDALLDALSQSYINTLASYRGNNNELTQIYTAGNTPSPLSDFLADIASHASRTRMLGRHTTTETGTRTFDFSKPDILPVPASFVQAVEAAMPAYTATLSGRVRYMPGYFRVKDVAQRVGQGLGSRGLPRYYVLVEGPTLSQDDDRILDVKLQGYPSAWPYIDPTVREQMTALISRDQAMRTVLGNRVLGYRVDEHLGTMALLGDSYGVRERTPARGTFEVRELVNVQRASRLAEVWGAVLATAHARADQDSSPLIPYDFERETMNKVGNQRAGFVAQVRQVALRYAAQVETDYKTFVDALARPAAPPQTANNKPTTDKL
jgi:uncharacterized protein (DUF2252 family)